MFGKLINIGSDFTEFIYHLHISFRYASAFQGWLSDKGRKGLSLFLWTLKKLFFFCFRQADLYAYISILFHIYSVCECNEHQPTARLSQGFLYLQKHTLHQQIYTIISKYENKWGKSIDLLIWINHIHYNKVHSNKKAI